MPKAQKKRIQKKTSPKQDEKKTKKDEKTEDEVVYVPLDSEEEKPKVEEVMPETEAEAQDTDVAEEELDDDSEVLNADDEISSLYDIDDDGTDIDMTTLEQRASTRVWFIFAALLVVLFSVVGYFGYRVFGGDPLTQEGDGEMEVELTVDEKVASGDVVQVEIAYTNNKTVDIDSGTVEVFYPDGFRFYEASVDPVDSRQRIWDVGTVAAGTGGKIRITGQLVGEADSQKQFRVNLTYQPSNFSHDFQTSAEATTQITTSIVDASVEVAEQVQSGQEFSYTVKYANASAAELNDVQISLVYPENFSYVSSSEEPSISDNTWRIGTLLPKEEKELTVNGYLDASSGSTHEFIFQLGVLELDNSFNVQVEKNSLVIVVNPELELSLTAPDLIEAGEDVPVTVTIKNSADVEINDFQVGLTFSGGLFDEEEHIFDTIDTVSAFDEVELTYSVPTNTPGNKAKQQQLEVVATVLSAKVEGQDVEFSEQPEKVIQVSGDLNVTAEGRYFDENLSKIGSGPLPPVVGEETTFVIEWSVATTLNPYENVSVSTSLPADVEWQSASGDVAYDSDSRKVVWNLGDVAARMNDSVSFEVSIVPKASDVDGLKVLTETTVVTGRDTFTGEQVSDELQRINSNISTDEGGAGKGIVVAE